MFIPLTVGTTGYLYDEFIRLLFLHAHREPSALDNELSEESDHFHSLRASCFAKLKVAVGLIMVNGHRLCGFQSPWTSHLGLSYRFLVSSVRVVSHHF